jgi:hypothetical protein
MAVEPLTVLAAEDPLYGRSRIAQSRERAVRRTRGIHRRLLALAHGRDVS